MGNFPLCIPRQDGVVFGDYGSELEQDEALLQSKCKDWTLDDNAAQCITDEEITNEYVQDEIDTTILGLELDKDSGQAFCGLLQFYCVKGHNIVTKNISIRNTTSVTELVPELLNSFQPHLEARADEAYIAVVEGGTERRLDNCERPLKIALDCATKGLPQPKFCFRVSTAANTHTLKIPPQAEPYVTTPTVCFSERSDSHTLMVKHSSSTNSFQSEVSMTSNKTTMARSTSCVTTTSRRSCHLKTSSNQELSKLPNRLSISQGHLSQDSLVTSSRKGKSMIPNFITRSLRVRRKENQTHYSFSDEEFSVEHFAPVQGLESSCYSNLIPADNFALSTVLHIYCTESKQAQVYKSILVSERATTMEVIAQALERYNMNLRTPDEFSLYDVVGQWEDVGSPFTAKKGLPVSCSTKQPVYDADELAADSVEQFVEQYSRELSPNESPYCVQFYFTTQKTFTRRFELRSKSKQADDVFTQNNQCPMCSASIPNMASESVANQGNTDGEISVPDDAFFGHTSHKRRGKKKCFSKQSKVLLREQSEIQFHNKIQSELEAQSNQAPAVAEESVRARTAEYETVAVQAQKNPQFVTSDKLSENRETFINPRTSKKDTQPLYFAMNTTSFATPFLFSLHLYAPQKEFLVCELQADTTSLVSCNEIAPAEAASLPREAAQFKLYHPSLAECIKPLCSVYRRPLNVPHSQDGHGPIMEQHEYRLSAVNKSVTLLLNGKRVAESDTVSLKHGDLISVGSAYLFMFQDYSSVHTVCNTTYSHTSSCHDFFTKSRTQSSGLTGASLPTDGCAQLQCEDEYKFSLQLNDTQSTNNACPFNEDKCLTNDFKQDDFVNKPNSSSDSCKNESVSIESESSACIEMYDHHNNPSEESSTSLEVIDQEIFLRGQDIHPFLLSGNHGQLMFSFSSSEEEAILNFTIFQQDAFTVSYKLFPAYMLAMCVEYRVMCAGRGATRSFVQKAIDCFQQVVLGISTKETDWLLNRDTLLHKDISLTSQVLPLLKPLVFWMANTIECYNFLSIKCQAPNVTNDRPGYSVTMNKRENQQEPQLQQLHKIMSSIFQQILSLISKVLISYLPAVIEYCSECRKPSTYKTQLPIVIDQVVDFLQDFLDMVAVHHVHLEVVSLLYGNVFICINTVMFNTLMKQGIDLHIYQYRSGCALRANMNLLEGWACQVGFKDLVLQYLATSSGAIDLLATPAEKLLNMTWTDLRKEFPVLSALHLQHLLSNYLLPVQITSVPKHWTPITCDTPDTTLELQGLLNTYDHYLPFRVPTTGYMLDLSKPPLETGQFYTKLEMLRKALVDTRMDAAAKSYVMKKDLHSEARVDKQLLESDIEGINLLEALSSTITSSTSSALLPETSTHFYGYISPCHEPLVTNNLEGQGQFVSNTEFQEGLIQTTHNRQTFGEGWKHRELSVKEKVAILEALPLATELPMTYKLDPQPSSSWKCEGEIWDQKFPVDS